MSRVKTEANNFASDLQAQCQRFLVKLRARPRPLSDSVAAPSAAPRSQRVSNRVHHSHQLVVELADVRHDNWLPVLPGALSGSYLWQQIPDTIEVSPEIPEQLLPGSGRMPGRKRASLGI